MKAYYFGENITGKITQNGVEQHFTDAFDALNSAVYSICRDYFQDKSITEAEKQKFWDAICEMVNDNLNYGIEYYDKISRETEEM